MLGNGKLKNFILDFQNFLSAPNVVISTGLRPKYPNIPGAELGITSDDLFTLASVPGKTLIVGGGYVALECAGFLSAFNQNVEVLVRSIPLKGFDRDCVHFVMEHLKTTGVKVKEHVEVERVEAVGSKKKVTFTGNGGVEEYDTVIWAAGRVPNLKSLNLDNAGVRTDKRSGKILADEFDRASCNGVYAVGDIVQVR